MPLHKITAGDQVFYVGDEGLKKFQEALKKEVMSWDTSKAFDELNEKEKSSVPQQRKHTGSKLT